MMYYLQLNLDPPTSTQSSTDSCHINKSSTDSCHVTAQPHMRYTSAVIAAIMLKFWFGYCARFHFSSTPIYPDSALLMYIHHIPLEVPNDSTRPLGKTEYRALWIPSSTAVALNNVRHHMCDRKQDCLYTMPIEFGKLPIYIYTTVNRT